MRWNGYHYSTEKGLLIKPKKGTYEEVPEKLGGKYDVKIVEELPFYLKILR